MEQKIVPIKQTNKIEVFDKSSGSEIDRLIETFYCLFDDYEPLGDKDRKYFATLIEEFGGTIDIEYEIKQFYAWLLDRPSEGSTPLRTRFRAWLKTAAAYKKRKQKNG